MDWPIFYGEELKTGNLDSPVGICTLWTKRDMIFKNVPEEKFSVCGNLYTIQGINPMIKNILAKPTIRYIILCGADLMKSGDALINFFNNGIDENKKINGSSGYIDSNVAAEHVEKIRRGVKIVDMRGKENEVARKASELSDPRMQPFAEPVFITELETKTASMATEEVAFKVRGGGVDEVWLKILNVIMKFGTEKFTEYKTNQKEIIDLIAVVEGDSEKISPWMKISEHDLENYYATFFGKEKPAGVTYTYGNRLMKYPLPDGTFFDQIGHVTNYLKKTPHTRRAAAFTWNVGLDRDSADPPCITQIVWNVKNSRLYQTAVIRSNDMFGAWPLNAYALRRMQKEIAAKIGAGVGDLVTISNSAHIYENNWREAKNILDAHYTDRIVQFNQDKNGYFIIKIENGEIAVEFYTKEGLPTEYRFRGNKAQFLYRKILNENLISLADHAAYLGHELARAEISLKEGRPFRQDEA